MHECSEIKFKELHTSSMQYGLYNMCAFPAEKPYLEALDMYLGSCEAQARMIRKVLDNPQTRNRYAGKRVGEVIHPWTSGV